MENVLMIGEDLALLSKRAAVLSRSGASVTCCKTDELDVHAWNEMYALVVLCHTLKPGVRRSVVVAEVYRRWPRARVLQILADHPVSDPDQDIVAGDMGERGELVELSTELLAESASSVPARSIPMLADIRSLAREQLL